MRLGAANARVTTVLDEDDLTSDSDTALATQQSIKAYVDAQPAGDVVGPSSAVLDNRVVRFDGTTGKLIQGSSVRINDANAMDGLTRIEVDNLQLEDNTLSSTDTDGDINLTPNRAGNVVVPAVGIDVHPGS